MRHVNKSCPSCSTISPTKHNLTAEARTSCPSLLQTSSTASLNPLYKSCRAEPWAGRYTCTIFRSPARVQGWFLPLQRPVQCSVLWLLCCDTSSQLYATMPQQYPNSKCQIMYLLYTLGSRIPDRRLLSPAICGSLFHGPD